MDILGRCIQNNFIWEYYPYRLRTGGGGMSKREQIKVLIDGLNDRYVDLVWSFVTGLIGGGVEHHGKN